MMDLAELDRLVDADNLRRPIIRGQWFPIQLVPDLGSDERINIGVGFVDDSGKLHARFISTVRGLSALYGRAASRNFQFLLALASDHVKRGGSQLTDISPHLKLGMPRFASGDDMDRIINGLFDTAVSLAWEDERERRDHPGSRGTEALRKTVFSTVRRQHEEWYARAIREQPVILKTHQGQTISADLPIWLAQGEMFTRPKFGTVVSAWFTSEEYRGYSLLKAYQDLVMARRYGEFGTSEVAGAAFVLKPPQGRFDLRRSEEINQDISRLANALEETGINVVVRDDPKRITDAVVEYIAST